MTDLGNLIGHTAVSGISFTPTIGLGQASGDIFQFDVTRSGFLDVQLTVQPNPTGLDNLRMTIDEVDPLDVGDQIASSDQPGNADEIIHTAITPGKYAITIQNNSPIQSSLFFLQISLDTGGGPLLSRGAALPTAYAASDGRQHGPLLEDGTPGTRDFVGFLDGTTHAGRDMIDLHVFDVPIQGRVVTRIDDLVAKAGVSITDIRTSVLLMRDIDGNGTFIDTAERLDSKLLDSASDTYVFDQTVPAGRYALVMRTVEAPSTGGMNYRLTFTYDVPDSPGATPATAVNIGSVGNGLITQRGYLSAADPVDMFRLNTVTGASGPFSFFGSTGETTAGSNFDLDFIRDTNNNGVVDTGEVIATGNRPNNVAENFTAAFTQPGTYFLRVRRIAGEGIYSFGTTIRNTDQGGSTLASSLNLNPLLGARQISDSLSRSDTADIFRFTLDRAATIRASMGLLPAGTNADLSLIQDLDNDGAIDPNEVLANSVNANNAPELITRSVPAGTYFIDVIQVAGTPTYTLHISDDTVGNTIATAREIGIAFDEFEFVGPGDGNDFYRLTVPSGGRSIGFFPGQLSEPVNLVLFQDTNNNSALDASEVSLETNVNGSGATIKRNLAAGTHFLRVRPLGTNGTVYGMFVANGPTDRAGNSMAEARGISSLSTPQTFNDFVGDGSVDAMDDLFDVYRFTAGTNGPFRFTANMTSSGGNADIQLVRDDNLDGVIAASEIVASSTKTDATDAIDTTLTVPGNYCIRIFRVSQQPNYTATFQAVSQDTAGNTPATAVNLGASIGQTINGGFVGAIDPDDFYRFTTSGPRSLRAQFTNSPAPAAPIFMDIIRDTDNDNVVDDGETIASSTATTSPVDLLDGVFLPASGTYFIRVRSPGTDSAYGLSFEVVNQTPFNTVFQINNNGPTTIQVENFDNGGEGIAFHDSDATNSGGNAFRGNLGVDIKPTNDSGGGFRVTDTAVGEFLEYTVFVNQGGFYDLDFRLSSPDPGARYHLDVDGVNVTGLLNVPDTNNFDAMTTQTRASVPLAAGPHLLRLAFDTQTGVGTPFAGAFNSITVRPTPGTTGTFALSPSNASVSVGRRQSMALEWTVPFSGWRVLKDVDIRFRDSKGIAMWLRFDEASNTLRVFDPEKGKFSAAKTVGGSGALSTPDATVRLQNTSIVASGSDDPSVVIKFDITFKDPARGRRFTIEAAATDDLGHVDLFAAGGTIRVT